jgi:hypothetical protein
VKIKNIFIAINENCNLKFIISFFDDLDDYYNNNDDVDYNEVDVVHDVGLMMIMMRTIMH